MRSPEAAAVLSSFQQSQAGTPTHTRLQILQSIHS